MLLHTQGSVHIRFEERPDDHLHIWLDIHDVHVGPVEFSSLRRRRLGSLLEELLELICTQEPGARS